MSDLTPEMIAFADSLLADGWRNLELLQSDKSTHPLKRYLYAWSMYLGTLSLNVYEAATVLVKTQRYRAAWMLLRPLIDYDVRLRYYVVQAQEALADFERSGGADVKRCKEEMAAARDWERLDIKLGEALTGSDPDEWDDDVRRYLQEAEKEGEALREPRFTEMCGYLREHDATFSRVGPEAAEYASWWYQSVRDFWDLESAYLHGDAVVAPNVLQFDADGEVVGVHHESAHGLPLLCLFSAAWHVLNLVDSVELIRGWSYGGHANRRKASRLYLEATAPV